MDLNVTHSVYNPLEMHIVHYFRKRSISKRFNFNQISTINLMTTLANTIADENCLKIIDQ